MKESRKKVAESVTVIPRIEEELEIYRHVRETGKVRVTTSFHEEIQTIKEPVIIHEVEVRRVPKNQVLTEPAQTRKVDGITIIPVMEERVVITKELVLMEEIHLVPVQKTDEIREDIILKKQTVDIERLSDP